MTEVLCWTIPLPEPIPLPGLTVVKVLEVGSLSPTVSVTPVMTERTFALNPIQDALFEASRKFAELPATTPQNATGPVITAPLTVVHLAATLKGDGGLDADAISDVFDAGLELVREMQRAYYIATAGPVSLVAHETLPMMVPLVSNGTPGVFLVSRYSMRQIDLPPSMTEPQIHAFHSLLTDNRAAFYGYADLRRESFVAVHARGDYRAAALAAATAAEVLLDTVLLHALWEEGAEPQEATREFESNGLNSRVRTKYQPRFGSSWSETDGSAIGAWAKDVAGLRHRTVHGGHWPSKQEAIKALASNGALEAHICDRLVFKARQKKYIRTAFALVGEYGFTKRNALTSYVRGELEHSDTWVEEFHSWRQLVTALRTNGR